MNSIASFEFADRAAAELRQSLNSCFVDYSFDRQLSRCLQDSQYLKLNFF